ncbi:MAG: phosphatase PAP2 family protein [Phycisphaerales bacterium]
MSTSHTNPHADRFAPWSTPDAIRAALLTTLIVWAASALDRAAFHLFHVQGVRDYSLFFAVKWLGTITPWLIIAVAILVIDALRAPPSVPSSARALHIIRRPLFLLASAISAGALAELLKIVFRRERPIYHDGLHMLRPLTERPFHSGGLDLPSSHVAVAFGAACALAFIAPPFRIPALLIASLVGVARMLEGSHSLSGVTLAAALAWACSRALAPLFSPHEERAA